VARLLIPALFVWLGIIALESLQGLVRRLIAGDELFARQIATFTGALLVLLIAFLTIRQLRPNTTAEALIIGAFWVALTLVFDIGLGRLTGASWQRIGADFDLAHGGLLPLGLLVMLFAPLIARRFRN